MQRKYQESLQEPKVKEEERGGRRKLALAVVQWESINSLVVGVILIGLNFIFLKQVRFAPILETLQGLVLNSNHGLKNLTYGVDVEKIRFMGILQRIAIAYFVAVLTDFTDKLVVAFVISYNIIFILAIRLIYVPDSEYQISTQDQGSTTFLYCTASKLFNNLKVKCGVRGRTRL
ncbi:unnamed protein product [Brassica rapa subsp. trilocularis]